MKLLLDECIPKRLRQDLPGHDVQTVEEAGLKGLKNGALLRSASNKFDVLITVDQNIPFQQNLPSFRMAVVILVAGSNRYSNLRMLAPKLLKALRSIKPGEVTTIR